MDQDIWNRDARQLAQGALMLGATVASAVLTATIVIILGQAVIERRAQVAPERAESLLVRVSH